MPNNIKYSLFAIILAIFSVTLFYFIKSPKYLQFSDAAKMGLVAKSIYQDTTYKSDYILFDAQKTFDEKSRSYANQILPVNPYLIALSYRIFGVNDFAIQIVSMIFFVLLVYLTYLLGAKLFDNKIGLTSAVFTALNLNLLNYAITGASEIVFIVILLTTLLLINSRKKLRHFSLIGMLLLFLTRPQAIFYIIPIVFYLVLVQTNKYKNSIGAALALVIFAMITILISFIINMPLLNIIKERVIVSLAHNSTFAPANDVLRTNINILTPLIIDNAKDLVSKFFYSLYNFYKLIPEIYSPYLFLLFLMGLFIKWKEKGQGYFVNFVTITIIIIFMSTAITAPLFRYLHPLIPLLTIVGSSVLFKILDSTDLGKYATYFLILFICVGSYIGNVFLDSRFDHNIKSYGKPPVYKLLAEKLKENTKDNQIIVTNLDTWGSWYGERKTIWYPLKSQDLENSCQNIDAIYLTSYLMDDENNYMGNEWREIYSNPNRINNKFISENYRFAKEFIIGSEENFEKIDAKGVLLIRNDK